MLAIHCWATLYVCISLLYIVFGKARQSTSPNKLDNNGRPQNNSIQNNKDKENTHHTQATHTLNAKDHTHTQPTKTKHRHTTNTYMSNLTLHTTRAVLSSTCSSDPQRQMIPPSIHVPGSPAQSQQLVSSHAGHPPTAHRRARCEWGHSAAQSNRPAVAQLPPRSLRPR